MAPNQNLREGTMTPMPVATKFDPQKHLRGAHGRFAAEANPTPAQQQAGNYRKGHVKIGGLDVSIENTAGSTRSGVDRGGKPWSVRMPAHYGYVRRTEGADGDHVDAYIGPGVHDAENLPVHVIDQVHLHNGLFDEHKAMIGFPTKNDAVSTYDAGFHDGLGPKRRVAVTSMSFGDFKDWLKSGDTKRPLSPALRAFASPPSFSVKPLRESGLPRRSLTRGEAWQRNGRLFAPHAGEVPIDYTGSRQMERPAGSFIKHTWKPNIPANGNAADHHALVGALTRHIQGEKLPTIVRAQEQGLIPEGTSGSTIRRAYNHAAMFGLHDFGVGVYDYAMDEHLQHEMKPMEPFIRYARRRINSTLTGRERGAWRPYRAEFGQKFPTPKFDRFTGEERKRVPPNQVLVKLAEASGAVVLARGDSSAAAKAKVAQVMHEWKHGKLRSWRGRNAKGGVRRGPKVTDQKQAIAIALSQMRRAAA
jgi:hypothetical protein